MRQGLPLRRRPARARRRPHQGEALQVQGLLSRLLTEGHAQGWVIQGSAKGLRPGMVNFAPAVGYHFCLALPTVFTQPGRSLLAIPVVLCICAEYRPLWPFPLHCGQECLSTYNEMQSGILCFWGPPESGALPEFIGIHSAFRYWCSDALDLSDPPLQYGNH